MVSPLQQKSIIDPPLADVLVNFKRDIFATLNCVKVGKINSFDVTKKTAEIQVLFKRVLPDQTNLSYPVLVDCPVFTLQGGLGSLQMPIKAGDQCLVLFSDRRLDEWFQNGTEAPPADGRLHHLSDGIALVGLNPLNSTLPDAPTNKVVLRYGDTSIELDSDSITMAGDTLVIDATDLSLVSSGGAEIDLIGAFVTIKNNTTTLLTLLNTLITTIEGIQVTGPLPLTPASVAALEAQKVALATLLA